MMSRVRRSSLELLILALAETAGLNTPYALQRHAGLSPGSTAPALRRLKKDGLLAAAPRAGRRKREYTLTKKGKEVLIAGWEQCLAEERNGIMGIPTDFDSILRIAWLAVSLGKRKGEGEGFLKGAAQQWAGMAQEAKHEAAKLKDKRSDPVGRYAWMRAHSEAHRLETEAAALNELSMLVTEQQV
jgi:DNA-binding PadR family transcriptional regulator